MRTEPVTVAVSHIDCLDETTAVIRCGHLHYGYKDGSSSDTTFTCNEILVRAGG